MRHRHEQWAKLFTSARLRKGWSYTRLCAETGLSERALISACTRGSFNSRSFTLITDALGIVVMLPPPTRVLTAAEAQAGFNMASGYQLSSSSPIPARPSYRASRYTPHWGGGRG